MTDKPPKPNRVGAWAVIVALLVILVFSLAMLYVGWGMGGDHPDNAVTASGYTAMTMGIIATVVLGVGLMALLFYSHRSGRD
ncbi:hypothetical protein [Reyranella massiliensis]|jgi:TRAP-type C4-dicarboxylate transport system permease small subunit|uniref:hypothetical protein n=1 Tax=Reyranella massiliensis TaxID=445220 RepID=UPI0005C2853F|nr:hypothetical protein [Reyranella massiliensis]